MSGDNSYRDSPPLEMADATNEIIRSRRSMSPPRSLPASWNSSPTSQLEERHGLQQPAELFITLEKTQRTELEDHSSEKLEQVDLHYSDSDEDDEYDIMSLGHGTKPAEQEALVPPSNGRYRHQITHEVGNAGRRSPWKDLSTVNTGILLLLLAVSLSFHVSSVVSGGESGGSIRYPTEFAPGKLDGDFAASVERIRGKRVVMIGDSVMRYKYINLIYFLRTGNTVSSVTNSSTYGSHNPINEKTWASWQDFYTAPFMNGTEQCDCHREPSLPGGVADIIENRHYREDDFDVSYFQYFVDTPPCTFRGRTGLPGNITFSRKPADWCFSIDGFLPYLVDTVKPDVVLFNTGLHAQISEATSAALSEFAPLVPRFVWFTTTNQTSTSIPEDYDSAIVTKLDALNTTSVFSVDSWRLSNQLRENRELLEVYWDATHFHGWVYDEMLRQAFVRL